MVYNIFACFAFSLSATQKDVVKEWCRFFQINVFHEYFPCRTNVLFFPASLMSSKYTGKNSSFSRLTDKHSQFGTFPNRIPRELPQTVSHNNPATGWPYRFRSRGTTGSSILDHDLGRLCFGTRIQISGHSLTLEFSIILGHLPLLPWYKLILRLLLDLRNLVVLIQYLLFLLLSFVMLTILAQ